MKTTGFFTGQLPMLQSAGLEWFLTERLPKTVSDLWFIYSGWGAVVVHITVKHRLYLFSHSESEGYLVAEGCTLGQLKF